MATVFDLVKAAGSIPLDELTVLSPQSPESVKEAVEELQRQKLVEVQPSPDFADGVVNLTSQGYRRALR